MVRIGCIILLVLFGMVGSTYEWLRHEFAHTITINPVSEALSPDGKWRAIVDETIDEPRFGGAVIIDTVRLRPASGSTRTVDILTVDWGGDDDRPRIAWTADDALQVTAANLSYVTVNRRAYDGVRIDLRFDPDDPVTRAAWLKWLDAPRGHPTSIRIATARSPDGNWIAAVDEVSDGWHFFPDDTVTLTSTRDPADQVRVLHVVTTEKGRGPAHISWANADELQVTVPNRSYVRDRKRDYQGVRIDLRFDPDDPAGRAAWLKQQYAPMPPPPDE